MASSALAKCLLLASFSKLQRWGQVPDFCRTSYAAGSHWASDSAFNAEVKIVYSCYSISENRKEVDFKCNYEHVD